MSSSCGPTSEYPCPPVPATGRVTTLVCGRYRRTKSRLTVVIPSRRLPWFRTSATAFRNTSGKITSTDFNSYVTVSTATGAPQREHGFMAASTEPGLGITPRMDVLGKRVVEIS